MNFLQINTCLRNVLRRKDVPRFVRTLLSSSYACENEWNKRIEKPTLKNADPDKLFTEINMRFARKQVVNAADMDVYVNSISTEDHLMDCKHLLHKFRNNRRTKDTLDSTHHAVIRAFLKYKKGEELLDLLESRVEYGIFPDDLCYNLLMDSFIEKNDFRNATRVAILKMLQEDFGNRLSNIFSLYSVFNYLKDENRSPMKKVEEEKAEEDDDEEPVYVRVPYKLNPWFDDHFDITNEMHLCGKTLYLVGRTFDDTLGRSSQLIGLSYYNKWAKADELLKTFASSHHNKIFSSDTIHIVSSIVDTLSEEQKSAGISFLDNLKKLANKASNDDIKTLLDVKLKEVERLEKNDTKIFVQKYEDWEAQRKKAIEDELFELLREEKLNEVKRKIEEMKEKERRLYFFENINKHEIEYVEARKDIDAKKKTAVVEDDYVPPVIGDVRKHS